MKMKDPIQTRIGGQDKDFFTAVLTEAKDRKPSTQWSAGFLKWIARRIMIDIYTRKHVQGIIVIEDGHIFGKWDQHMNPVPCQNAIIKFYDPYYGKMYREELHILNLDDHEYEELGLVKAD